MHRDWPQSWLIRFPITSTVHFELLANGKPVDPMSNAPFKRPMLRGSDLERFRKLATQSLANRDTVAALVAPAQILQADNQGWNLVP
jgi:hypothetical protein